MPMPTSRAIALWNLARLAECLLPLLADEQEKAIAESQDLLDAFAKKFSTAYQAGLRKKIGLFTARDGDEALVQDLLDAMAKNQADFTLTFRRLSDAALDTANDGAVRQLFADPAAFDDWAVRWRQRTGSEPQSGARTTQPRCERSIRRSFRAITASKPSSTPRSTATTTRRSRNC